MKYVLIALGVLIMMSACGKAAIKNEINYEIPDVYYGIQNKEGDIWTGVGNEKTAYSADYLQKYKYAMNMNNDSAIPMRIDEVLGRIYVLGFMDADGTLIEPHYEHMILREAQWVEGN
ncbi:MAG: TraV family lipoprotein [Brevinematales bacterium]|nr:TraV family lipoprotein [Brevinematales bacterium]